MAKTADDGSEGDQPRRMHIISRKKLRGFCRVHPDSEEALDNLYNVVRKARWRNFSDLRATFGNADQVEKFVVFNVEGNKYRLIAQIYYNDVVILIRHVLTHKEYDEGSWKSAQGQ